MHDNESKRRGATHSLVGFSLGFMLSDAQMRLCPERFRGSLAHDPCSFAFAVLDVPKCTGAALSFSDTANEPFASQSFEYLWVSASDSEIRARILGFAPEPRPQSTGYWPVYSVGAWGGSASPLSRRG